MSTAKPTVVEQLLAQITELVADRVMAREASAFVRYQLTKLSQWLIDNEISTKEIGSPEADRLLNETITALIAVAKKTDKDTAALLRRFAQILEADYACVRSAAKRRGLI